MATDAQQQIRKSSSCAPDLSMESDSVRERVLDRVFMALAILGLPPIAAVIVKLVGQDRWYFASVYIIPYVALLAGILFKRKCSFPLRAAIFLIGLYLLGIILLVQYGLGGAGIWLLLTLCVVTVVLFDYRFGLIVAAFCAAAIFFTAAGTATDFINAEKMITMLDSGSLVSWAIAGCLFIMLAAVLVLVPGTVVSSLVESNIRLQAEMANRRAAEQELKKSQYRLEMAVEDRTLELVKSHRKLEREMAERRCIEDELVRSERLAATGRLAASVAHEINSPLQGIMALISVMKKEGRANREWVSNADMVGKACHSIRDTVRKLLDLNRPEGEEKHPLIVNDVINDTASLVKSLLNKKGIDLRLELAESLPVVTASRQQMGQCFMNLINNAMEAIDAGNQQDEYAGLKRGEIRISTSQSEGGAAIRIVDNGPGISPEDLPHVFDPFFTRRKKMGMGIGLSICHGTVVAHGGSISVTSQDQEGAVFTIVLPVNRAI